MQTALTMITVAGGMAFSLAVALLAEELIFGQVIRIFFRGERRLPQIENGNGEAVRKC